MRAIPQILLALLLLLAQQQALTHPFLHLQEGAPAHAAGDAGEHPPSESACDLHATYAQVLGAIDAAAPLLACIHDTAGPGDGVRAAAGFAARVVAVSRGPPAHH